MRSNMDAQVAAAVVRCAGTVPHWDVGGAQPDAGAVRWGAAGEHLDARAVRWDALDGRMDVRAVCRDVPGDRMDAPAVCRDVPGGYWADPVERRDDPVAKRQGADYLRDALDAVSSREGAHAMPAG